MEEINTQVAELNTLYKTFQEKPNKQTSISFRKGLMKLKNTSHSLRKNVLLSMKPKPVEQVAPVAPEATIEPVTPVEPLKPPVKKAKRSKSSKKEKQKITKETKATTVKFN